MSAPARVSVRTLGCKVNRAESESLVEELVNEGAVLCDGTAADVVIVNTCTVTAEADAKARKAVRQALKACGGPVVVTGCLAAIDAAGLAAIDSRVIVEPEKALVAGRVRAFACGIGAGGPALRQASAGETRPLRGHPSLQDSLRTPHPDAPYGAPTLRTRVAVKVQDGCDHRCSYCIVPDARGSSRSVSAHDVVAHVAALVAGGTAEVVLTGVNIGRYTDGPAAPDLAALVGMVADTGIERIRVSSIEPLDLTDRLLSRLGSHPAVLPHLHVPLQAGCDRTLLAMRRGYGTEAFAGAIERAREALPGLSVTTDVIVGFPGETPDDFQESLAFVEACGFSRLHVFRYSPRVGTPAASMPGTVDPEETASRALEMRGLGERLATARARGRIGGTARVLVERCGDGCVEGLSEDYIRVRATGVGNDRVRRGDVVTVSLVSEERGWLLGLV